MEMDINCDSIRGRFSLPSKNSSRNSSISLSALYVLYYQYIKINNNLPDVESRKPVDSS